MQRCQWVTADPLYIQYHDEEWGVPVSTPESEAMSKDLKKRGFKYVGPTICYSFMQAVGMVNDHTIDCFCYPKA